MDMKKAIVENSSLLRFLRMHLIVLHRESAASEIKDPNNSFHTFDVLNHAQPAYLNFAF